MVAPNAVVVTERRVDAPTRRVVYEPRDVGGYRRIEELWRQSIADWHQTGTEIVTAVEVSR